MQNTIKDGEGKGLTKSAYSSKPMHESNFKKSIELGYLKDPDNFIEEINSIIERIGKLFNRN